MSERTSSSLALAALEFVSESEWAEFLYGDHDISEEFVAVTEPEHDGKSRWEDHYHQVFRHNTEGTYWRVFWTRGATEYQDEGPQNVHFCQVYPKEVTVIKYVTKKPS